MLIKLTSYDNYLPFLCPVSSQGTIHMSAFMFIPEFLAYILYSTDVEWKKCFTIGDSVESSLQKGIKLAQTKPQN